MTTIRQAQFDAFRERNHDLPWPIVEAMLARIVVGDATMEDTDRLAQILRRRFILNQENAYGDGI